MFCYQCEQTQRPENAQAGCATLKGSCGKDSSTADLQDLLIEQIQGIAQYAVLARSVGHTDKAADDFIQYGFFTTLTNVNFNSTQFVRLIAQGKAIRDTLRAGYEAAATQAGKPLQTPQGPAAFEPASDLGGLLAQSASASVAPEGKNAEVHGLEMLILYGLKGVCAYSHHARMLGFHEEGIDARIAGLIASLAEPESSIETLFDRAMQVGALNLDVMALLDRANTTAFGHPEITQVRLSPVQGKAILVSGHDLHDLQALLEQTQDTGIFIYTHGEMLPAHAYPGLKKYPHLAGNYGGAWQDQQQEFAAFPGPILMTSNCLIEPDKRYRARIFTTGPVGFPGLRHLENGDFAPLIQAAQALPGFKETAPEAFITTGFAHNTVLGVADKVIEAVKSGAITRFFVIGGCDGAKPGRNYYTELAQGTPDNTVMLTLGCAKYRFNKQDFGDIGGIPRLLDLGQCNDAHSAITIASALAKAFDCTVNDLPLSLMISWFEQKATAVLLSLLHLGVRGIHLGPTLPAYLSPTLLAVLQDRFDLRINGSAQADLAQAMAKAA